MSAEVEKKPSGTAIAYRFPEIPLGRGEGSFEITDEALVRAPAWVLREFADELTHGARRFGVQVTLYRDLLRCTTLISWEPAKDPRLVGVWKLA